MKRKIDIELIRNTEAGDRLEVLLVSSVASILFIRFLLFISGYPQIGGSGFHIAHMLWGGLLMLIAIVLLLTFLGRNVRVISSIIGGIGFGTFIYELGKFITQDNNYFYQPTIALLYLIFLFLFFMFRYIERHRHLSQKEYLMNAIQLLEEVVNHDMDSKEKKELLNFLKSSNADHILTKQLTTFLTALDHVPEKERNPVAKKAAVFLEKIETILVSRAFEYLFVCILVLYSAYSFYIMLFRTIFSSGFSDFISAGQFTSTLASLLLTILGVLSLKISRINSFNFFKNSILISILITQFFIFYNEQFHALYELALSVILLGYTEYQIKQEKEVKLRRTTQL